MIPFTQYLMPDGREVQITISRLDPIEVIAKELIRLGYRFEAEMLSDYSSVSLEIMDRQRENSIAGALIPNGPEIPVAVDRMILEAAEKLKLNNFTGAKCNHD